MQSAIPAQELPARNALTVAANCVNRTRKHAASVTAYSVLRACPSIQCSTPNLHRQSTGKIENEKGLKNYGTAAWDAQGFFQPVRVISCKTLRTALASFYIGHRLVFDWGDFECNDSITMSAMFHHLRRFPKPGGGFDSSKGRAKASGRRR